MSDKEELLRDLTHVVNKHSLENESGTPDFILANHMLASLEAFNVTIRRRGEWRGESLELPALQHTDHRDAGTGRFVSKEFADEHPDTTVEEHNG